MKTIILAGGLGTRLAEETEVRPKPMVEIGGKPVLWHIMNIYAAAGFHEFVVALGHRGEQIKDYFHKFHAISSDLTVELRTGRTTVHDGVTPDWKVHLVDTGAETMTGGRIRRLAKWVGSETFMLTYGDGVADIDISHLLKFHQSHGRMATVTAVRPPARFGGLRLEGNKVVEFTEKSQSEAGWINGGFFVLEPQVIDYISGDHVVWEREPLEQIAAAGELMAYRHAGYWQPMDTLRDKQQLQSLWETGRATWKLWK